MSKESGNENLIKFIESLLEKAKKKEISGMAGVLFDKDFDDFYYTAGFAPRSLVVGGITLLLDDLKVHAMYENHKDSEEEDTDEDLIEEKPPGTTLN